MFQCNRALHSTFACFSLKKVNPMFEVGVPPETVIARHCSGWLQAEIFAPTWFNNFLRHTKPTAEDPVLLILNGHSTHVKNMTLIEMVRANNACFGHTTSHIT